MCDALRELMKGEIEAEAKKLAEERINAEVNRQVQERTKQSVEATEKRINALNLALSKADRIADIIKAAEDHDYQQKLFEEFGL